MKPRAGWLLTANAPATGVINTVIAAVVPTRKVTNRVVDDIVREWHLKAFGRLWPNKTEWKNKGEKLLVLQTPVCTYKLTRLDVYG